LEQGQVNHSVEGIQVQFSALGGGIFGHIDQEDSRLNQRKRKLIDESLDLVF